MQISALFYASHAVPACSGLSNYNLYIVDNIDKIIELKENLRNFEAVKKVLFFSGVTIRNPILSDIKSGNITY